jgi:hypothetical protein
LDDLSDTFKDKLSRERHGLRWNLLVSVHAPDAILSQWLYSKFDIEPVENDSVVLTYNVLKGGRMTSTLSEDQAHAIVFQLSIPKQSTLYG